MAAEHNIQVCQPTTPAQYFHLLRRQVIRKWRKPLVVLSPKSLLRHPRVISPLAEMTDGSFQKILSDEEVSLEDADRLLFCTGKIYYDLIEAREEKKLKNVAIMRIEQLYPLNVDELLASISQLPKGKQIYWVQEEPTNMGAWPYIKLIFSDELSRHYDLKRVSRVESASPSTGSMAAHKLEQAELIDEALADL